MSTSFRRWRTAVEVQRQGALTFTPWAAVQHAGNQRALDGIRSEAQQRKQGRFLQTARLWTTVQWSHPATTSATSLEQPSEKDAWRGAKKNQHDCLTGSAPTHPVSVATPQNILGLIVRKLWQSELFSNACGCSHSSHSASLCCCLSWTSLRLTWNNSPHRCCPRSARLPGLCSRWSALGSATGRHTGSLETLRLHQKGVWVSVVFV